MYFYVTEACNLNCRHCWVSAGQPASPTLQPAEIVNVLHQLNDAGTKKVKFSGGEPFARPDFCEILESIQDSKMMIEIDTNGYRRLSMDEKGVLQTLDVRLNISIDSPNPNIHDAFRGTGGALERTLSTMHECCDLNVPFRVVTCCQENNALPPLIELSMKVGAERVRIISDIMPVGRADSGFSCMEIQNIIDRYRVIADCQEQYRDYVSSTVPPAFARRSEFERDCRWGVTVCSVLSNGDIGPCGIGKHFPELIAGNVRSDDILDIWSYSPLFVRMRNIDLHKLDGVCGLCRFSDSCGGMCRAFTYSRYRSLNAPYPPCQDIYDSGLFPPDALRANAQVGIIDSEELAGGIPLPLR